MLRVNWTYIKGLCLLSLVGFLFVFSSFRNAHRSLSDIQVNFLGNENLFITEDVVNKLLIQNQQGVASVTKEILDLNKLELALNSNPMIKTAQVYVTINGEVKADIIQKKPIARVHTDVSYYIDQEGSTMPLSNYYTARTPLVTGHVKKDDLDNIFVIASKIYNDEFLKTHITEIHQNQDRSIILKMRVYDFEIWLGHIDNLDKKINNLKAFYQKAKKDKTLEKYIKVNLQFENQVVCTKR